jgi:hypothetical protein
LPDYRLILECYPPSAKLSTPYLYCNYLYTDSLDGAEDETPAKTTPLGGGLNAIYAHFRPIVQDENRRGRARYPRRRQQQQQQNDGGHDGTTNGQASSEPPKEAVEEKQQLATQDLYLDAGELFSQLCTVTNLVRVGPRPGLFLSHVNVSDGLVRAWRGWLAAQASATSSAISGQGEGEGEGEGGGNGEGSVLWADTSHTVGVRFGVSEKDIRGEHPVLVASDEELPVAYRLEFEELLVRAGTLLMMVEKSEVQEVAPEGKAIVIAF